MCLALVMLLLLLIKLPVSLLETSEIPPAPLLASWHTTAARKLTINGTEQTGEAVKAIGEGSLTSAEKIKAFSAEQLKSGLVAFLLQENVSGSAKWGQNWTQTIILYLALTNKVYSDGPVIMKCSGELEGTGTFTNTKPAQEGTFTIKHGDSPIHHESVAATCTADGNIEYWECNLCHKSFSDEQYDTRGEQSCSISNRTRI